MTDKTAVILFKYLKDILYSPSQAKLDISSIPGEFQKLGMGLLQIGEWISETREFSKAVACGDLSKEPPGVENVIAAPLKELQGSLRHLTWQTQQIAKGDFSQQVDFMGAFSEAFNSMTKQLAEHTANLLEEKKKTEIAKQQMEKSLNVMLSLMDSMHDMISVVMEESQSIAFMNRKAEQVCSLNAEFASKIYRSLEKHNIEETDEFQRWELDEHLKIGDKEIYFNVESFYINWYESTAKVHILTDETERREKESFMYDMAYVDSMTGLKNRRYATEKMGNLIKDNKVFLLSLIDIDYLKFCNDEFGHESGDDYIKNVANLLTNMHCDVCRVGGDEFYLISEGRDIAEHDKTLFHLREIIAMEKKPYPQSFSYATGIIPAGIDGDTLKKYVRQIDENMYAFKKKYKKSILQSMNYHDERI